MVEPHIDNPGHDETIVPVKPGLKEPSGPLASSGDRPPADRLPLLAFALAGLVATALAVVFVLPRWVADRQAQESLVVEAAAAPAAEPAGPVLTPEEIEALRVQAEALLAELLSQQARLDNQSAADWGGPRWERYEALSRAGDDAVLAHAYHDAVPAYTEALAIGTALLARSVQIIDSALAAGTAALDAGNAQLAAEQFQLVLGIEPDNAVAQDGLLRAERLPEVLALMRRGDELQRAGQLEDAAQAYRAALAIDAAWAQAQAALNAVVGRLANQEYEALMSRGLAALSEEEYSDAYELFGAALVIRPESRQARDGQGQAAEGQKLDQIALVEARAFAFERRELWEMAVQQYQAALSTDATLAFAQAGLVRARARADLDAKLRHLIANPNLLFGDQVLADARALLSEARQIEEPGPRLEEQTASLDRLVMLASTPVAVELHSDERTSVALYRIGVLGTFAVRQVELRPGTYTAVGSRDGYRDVRKTFTVLPGRVLPPVRVECIEPI